MWCHKQDQNKTIAAFLTCCSLNFYFRYYFYCWIVPLVLVSYQFTFNPPPHPRCLTNQPTWPSGRGQYVTKTATLRNSEPQDILIWRLNHCCPVSSPSCVKRKRRVSFTATSFPNLQPAALNTSQSCPSFTCSIQLVFCVNWTVSTGAFPEVTGGSFLVRGFKTWTVSTDAQLKRAARAQGSICVTAKSFSC